MHMQVKSKQAIWFHLIACEESSSECPDKPARWQRLASAYTLCMHQVLICVGLKNLASSHSCVCITM